MRPPSDPLQPTLQAHSKKGETPLIWAAMQQQLDCLKVLITARANLNAQAPVMPVCRSW